MLQQQKERKMPLIKIHLRWVHWVPVLIFLLFFNTLLFLHLILAMAEKTMEEIIIPFMILMIIIFALKIPGFITVLLYHKLLAVLHCVWQMHMCYRVSFAICIQLEMIIPKN